MIFICPWTGAYFGSSCPCFWWLVSPPLLEGGGGASGILGLLSFVIMNYGGKHPRDSIIPTPMNEWLTFRNDDNKPTKRICHFFDYKKCRTNETYVNLFTCVKK